MGKFKAFNREVFFAADPIVTVRRADLEFIKKKAAANSRGRARLCTHKTLADNVHEMLITLAKGVYIRPHKHKTKSESFHVISGRLDVVIFNDKGEIKKVIRMGDYSSGLTFFYRMNDSRYHTVLPRSPLVVFHETTGGPLKQRSETVHAPWSPDEAAADGVRLFDRRLQAAVRKFLP